MKFLKNWECCIIIKYHVLLIFFSPLHFFYLFTSPFCRSQMTKQIKTSYRKKNFKLNMKGFINSELKFKIKKMKPQKYYFVSDETSKWWIFCRMQFNKLADDEVFFREKWTERLNLNGNFINWKQAQRATKIYIYIFYIIKIMKFKWIVKLTFHEKLMKIHYKIEFYFRQG